MFVIVGFGFKISAVPFHTWAPDTYEGAPTPVTAFLSVASKAAGFVALVTLLFVAFPAADDVYQPFIWVLAALDDDGSATCSRCARRTSCACSPTRRSARAGSS